MTQKTEVSNAVALAVNARIGGMFAEYSKGAETAGATLFKALGEFFATTSEAEIIAATTPVKVGVSAKLPNGKQNPEAVRLSQVRANYRVFRSAPATFAAIGSDVNAGKLRGWNAIMEQIRDAVNGIKAEKVEAAIVAEAATLARSKHRDDPQAAEKAAEVYAQERREAKLAVAAERKAERSSVAGVTKRIAEMLVTKFGREFAQDVCEGLADAIDAAYKAHGDPTPQAMADAAEAIA